MSPRGIIAGAGSLVGVLAVAGVMTIGSHAIRQARVSTAAVVASPSASPIAQTCISAEKCTPTSGTSCVPGEGGQCASAPIVSLAPTIAPTPGDLPPNTRAPAGQIQISAVSFVAPSSPTEPGKLRLMVAVLSGADWVAGANVTARCTGPGLDRSTGGSTAPRSSWPSNVTPGSPSSFFWDVLVIDPSSQSQGGKYVCHGTASYNGLSASF